MIYEIIDTRTGERAKAYELAQEPWARVLQCDWLAFAVDETGDVMLTDDCGNYDMVPEGRVEVRLVIDREKWELCPGCGLAYLTQDGVFIKPWSEKILIYCRYCGRPLTDAAWAELEKKIRGCVE